MKTLMPYLVVLAPTFACIALLVGVYIFPAIIRMAESSTIKSLEWTKEIVMHGAWFGSAISGFFGWQRESTASPILVTIWFVSLMAVSRLLTLRIAALEEHERSQAHRRTAGTVRSIVRDEVTKALEIDRQRHTQSPDVESACKLLSDAYTGGLINA